MIITIDGPAASGKSTVSRRVAMTLGFKHLDTGAMYRALTWKAINKKIDLEDIESLVSLARRSIISFDFSGKNTKEIIYLDGEDVSEGIRQQNVSQNVSTLSYHAAVRLEMVKLQREIAREDDTVAEGRDCGTVVFPEADLKIYLTASIEERARRRGKELEEKGLNINFNKLKEEIILRDKKDSTREISPLIKAADAIEIDTTRMSIDKVVETIIDLVGEG